MLSCTTSLRSALEPVEETRQITWSELRQEADNAAANEHPSLALIRIEYMVPFGDYTKAGYQYIYTDPDGQQITALIHDKPPYQPILSVFEKGEALGSVSFTEWQQREGLLRTVTTTPQQIIDLTITQAKKIDETARIYNAYLTTHPQFESSQNSTAVWIVTYVIDRTRKSQVFFIDAANNTIIEQWGSSSE